MNGTIIHLVGCLEHLLCFHSVGNLFIPTDEVIFFRRGRSTANPYIFGTIMIIHIIYYVIAIYYDTISYIII